MYIEQEQAIHDEAMNYAIFMIAKSFGIDPKRYYTNSLEFKTNGEALEALVEEIKEVAKNG